jgi:cytochrome b involved in lipid metabolism
MATETYYPTGRDSVLKTASRWLKFKQQDDSIGLGFWRIHDGLYDLTDFAKTHPGGEEWITMTEGHDITEAFEAAHVRGAKLKAIAKNIS